MASLTSTHNTSKIFPDISLSCSKRKNLTPMSGQSASTGNLQIASPISWWFRPHCRWQFAFHRGSTPQNRHCICEKSVDESTDVDRGKTSKNLPSRVPPHCRLALTKKLTKMKRKLTCSCAPSASTGNLQIASPKSWWFRRYCRWQFAFHRDSTPQKGPWDCKKSGHESTERERETLRNELETKNVLVWVPGLTGLSS